MKILTEDAAKDFRKQAAKFVAVEIYKQLREKSLASPDNQDLSDKKRRNVAAKSALKSTKQAFSKSYTSKLWKQQQVGEFLKGFSPVNVSNRENEGEVIENDIDIDIEYEEDQYMDEEESEGL